MTTRLMYHEKCAREVFTAEDLAYAYSGQRDGKVRFVGVSTTQACPVCGEQAGWPMFVMATDEEEGPEYEDISASRADLDAPATCKTCGMYLPDQDAIVSHLNNTTHPAASIVPAGAFFGNDARAWAEDEADMQRIKDEWEAFDRDPPGS